MTLSALPTLYDLDDPTSNLAGFEDVPTQYVAWDGTPIGEGNTCAPMRYNEGLMGAVIPEALEEKRIGFGASYALPLLVGVLSYVTNRRPGRAVLWGLGAYMAPLPVAGVFGYMHVNDMGGWPAAAPRVNRKVPYKPRTKRNWER